MQNKQGCLAKAKRDRTEENACHVEAIQTDNKRSEKRFAPERVDLRPHELDWHVYQQ